MRSYLNPALGIVSALSGLSIRQARLWDMGFEKQGLMCRSLHMMYVWYMVCTST